MGVNYLLEPEQIFRLGRTIELHRSAHVPEARPHASGCRKETTQVNSAFQFHRHVGQRDTQGAAKSKSDTVQPFTVHITVISERWAG